MESNICAGCRFYDPRKMYCHSYLAGIENVAWRCTVNNDIVPVVRCRDCKHMAIGESIDSNGEEETWTYCRLFDSPIDDNDFCSRGERKDDEK